MAKRDGFRKAAVMGLFLSFAVAGSLSAQPMPKNGTPAMGTVGPFPDGHGLTATAAKDDPGGLKWVSRDATYEVSSQSSDQYNPRPGLLTGQGQLYAVPGAPDSFAFHTKNESNPHIIIALAGTPTIQRLFIENRRGGGFESRASGLTVWVSVDKKSWRRVWTAQRVAPSWMVKLDTPVDAAYVKIGLNGTNYLHLRRVKIYGSSMGIPAIRRLGRTDRIEVNNGDVLLGTIENKSYTVTMFYGKIEVPARSVVGIAPAGDESGPVRLVQTDGQVIAGTLADEPVELTLATGGTLRVPSTDIRQFSYRISKDRPAVSGASQPVVLLRSGDRLIWTQCPTKLQLTGPWGTIDLPARSLQRLEQTDTEGPVHRVRFPNGTVLAGTLEPEKLTLKLKVVPKLEIALKDIRLIALPTKAIAPLESTATVKLRDGNRIIGQLENETLSLPTEFGRVEVHTSDVKTLTFDAERAGYVTIAAWDGTTLSGQLATPKMTCRIGPNGPRVSLLTTQIASITQSSPLLRPADWKKVEKLIAQLAAESHVDRETATQELLKMGKGVVTPLKKHANDADPEVRRNIERILKQLSPK